MKKPVLEIENAKIVNLLDALRILQLQECEELGIEPLEPWCSYTLPDGRESIKDRLWNEIIHIEQGNQQFCNDTLFRLNVTDEENLFSDDMNKLKELCKDALNYDPVLKGCCSLYFDVCW